MAAKVVAVFACQSCGATSPKWLGRCPDCGEWNSFAEELRGPRRGVRRCRRRERLAIGRIEVEDRPRLDDGSRAASIACSEEGSSPGSVILIGGEPGIGKSTLLLQAGRGLAARERDVLYASAEESAAQVRLRGGRLGIREEKLLVLAETDVSRIVAEAEARGAGGRRDRLRPGGPGAVARVRARYGLAGPRGGGGADALRQVPRRARCFSSVT